MCTMQAPHNPAPQPNFVPISLTCSRMIQSSGVCGGASELTPCPLMRNVIGIRSSLCQARLQFANMHYTSIMCDAAIWSLTGEKRTWRDHRESVATDPFRHFERMNWCGAQGTSCCDLFGA